MEAASAIDIYTTVLGWTLYDRIWQALLDTGLAYLPFFAVVARHFAGSWGEAGNEGAADSVRRIELELAGLLTVAALTGAPVLEIRVGDLSHTAACGAQTSTGGNTGTLYDSTFNVGGGAPAMVPAWWRAVMAVSAGFSNVAVAAIPCDPNVRQLNYQMDNTRIADAGLRQQLQLFDADCYRPAKAKFAREIRSLPTGYLADDINWFGSQYFQDTAGFYSDPNPSLPPRAREEIPGFPFDPNRDSEYGGTAPASGLGKPTCLQWWTDGAAGLRVRLLAQIDPQTLQAMKNAAKPPATPLYVEDSQIRKLVDTTLVASNPLPSAGQGGLPSLSNWLTGFLGTAGVMVHAVESQATFYALQQAAPIAQSLVLMAIYLCLPFVLVFSSYSLETAMLAAVGIFALRFLTALWALSSWLDTAMTQALGIAWYSANSGSYGVAFVVAEMTGYLTFVGLPLVWFLALGWAGHHLAAGGAVGEMAGGIGKAAGGATRFAGKAATRFAGKGLKSKLGGRGKK